jgi:hypothetical protein
MRSASWRQYRGHLIVKRRTWLFGLKRFDVWDGGSRVGTFGDVVSAELHIDRRRSAAQSLNNRSGTYRPLQTLRRGYQPGDLIMLWTIAVILVVLWLLGFLAFHVGGGLIHLLLVLAVIVIIWQLVTGRRSV